MIHLQQIATPIEDIIAGLCFALARNFKATMFKGRIIEPVIAFQGGVAANKGMIKAFKNVLGVDEILIPDNFEVTGAIGAALKSKTENVYLSEEMIEKLANIKAEIEYGLPPLKNEEEIFDNKISFMTLSHSNGICPVNAYLGIDVGSVSTNIVLIDEEGNLIIKKYLPTLGKPIDAVKRGLDEINKEILEIQIKGVGVTGSGRYMIADFVGADIVKNEITAHAYGAINYDQSVDTILKLEDRIRNIYVLRMAK